MKMGKAKIAMMAVVLGLSFTSCDKYIYDGAGTCEVSVRFKYVYNMGFTDAFAERVHSVTLYVFDPATGKLVTKVSDSGQHLDDNYFMTIPDLTTGIYDLVAWCGLEESEFTVTEPTTKEELFCLMNTKTKATYMDIDAGALYHGMVNSVNLDALPEGSANTVVIPLVKDTNSIVVALHTLDDTFHLVPEDYEITIVDNNAKLDWKNDLWQKEDLTYYPWDVKRGSAEYDSKTLPVVVAEFTTNRLVKQEDYKARLHVTHKETGNIIINIPLIDLLLLVKGNYNARMSDQEYLDRQDEYKLIFFLGYTGSGGDPTWDISAGININSWHIVWQNTNL